MQMTASLKIEKCAFPFLPAEQLNDNVYGQVLTQAFSKCGKIFKMEKKKNLLVICP